MIQNAALYFNTVETLKSPQYSNDKDQEMRLEYELIKSAQVGDPTAIEALLLRYRGVVVAALDNINIPDYEQEDLIQEALIMVFRKISSFKFNSKLSTWIYRVSRNVGLELYRHRRRRIVSVVSVDNQNENNTNAVVQIPSKDSKDNNPNSEVIKLCIKQLSPVQKTCLTLYYYQDFDYNQIAETINIPLGTVKTHIFRGKQALKLLLEKYHPNTSEIR